MEDRVLKVKQQVGVKMQREDAETSMRDAFAAVEARAEAAEAEIERLRFALGAIANLHSWPDNLMGDKEIAATVLGSDRKKIGLP